jgi:hypothetical protein
MARIALPRALAAVLVSVCLIPPVGAGEAEVPIGTTIKNLRFKDIRYLTRTLDDLPRSKAYVLVFTNTTCPLAGKYLPALNKLDKAYRGKSVQFLAVNVGAEDSIRGMAAQAIEYEAEYPFVKDFDARCAAALGVKRTPEGLSWTGSGSCVTVAASTTSIATAAPGPSPPGMTSRRRLMPSWPGKRWPSPKHPWMAASSPVPSCRCRRHP